MIEETTEWEGRFAALLAEEQSASDAAHDEGHVRRVVANAKKLAEAEGADLAVVLPAAWLHDCVVIAKNSPQRSSASRLAAERAGALLSAAGYPAQHIPAIEHAIEAHSFSARVAPQTIEAKVVVDPTLVGGVVARVGDLVFDGSIASRLEDAKHALGS